VQLKFSAVPRQAQSYDLGCPRCSPHSVPGSKKDYKHSVQDSCYHCFSDLDSAGFVMDPDP
jgi:hypothetical protein